MPLLVVDYDQASLFVNLYQVTTMEPFYGIFMTWAIRATISNFSPSEPLPACLPILCKLNDDVLTLPSVDSHSEAVCVRLEPPSQSTAAKV